MSNHVTGSSAADVAYVMRIYQENESSQLFHTLELVDSEPRGTPKSPTGGSLNLVEIKFVDKTGHSRNTFVDLSLLPSEQVHPSQPLSQAILQIYEREYNEIQEQEEINIPEQYHHLFKVPPKAC
eukprot:TRINITY_DN4680_c0_g4_i3.p1 TRINITY_DN4680_c0_g4~~TRINITY_DN4680_c0_g4_i3.p1  ORF type:complete len:125 (-),score=21.87 TRINITY_DN4680_c0_g4_i3:156-530(-)